MTDFMKAIPRDLVASDLQSREKICGQTSSQLQPHSYYFARIQGSDYATAYLNGPLRINSQAAF